MTALWLDAVLNVKVVWRRFRHGWKLPPNKEESYFFAGGELSFEIRSRIYSSDVPLAAIASLIASLTISGKNAPRTRILSVGLSSNSFGASLNALSPPSS